jgi:hypothetical protein
MHDDQADGEIRLNQLRWSAAFMLHEVAMCETCKKFLKMCNTSGVKQHELCVIIGNQQTLVREMTSVNKETIMKTEKTPEKKIIVVYRKDGKTPDLRYKSSRAYVLSQHLENNKEQKKDLKTVSLRYTGLRDHILLHQTAIPKDIPVQIKPSGKKPVWKVSS